MKTLSLLRHGRSIWLRGRDIERPLDDKGERAARRMGEWLRTQALRFDHVLASPAQRISETLVQVEQGYGQPLSAIIEPRLYLAPASTLCEILRHVGDEHRHILIIGHNPGLSTLVQRLTIDDPSSLRRQADEKYPTATYAQIALPIDHWAELRGRMNGRLRFFVRPRDLDPGLGPGK